MAHIKQRASINPSKSVNNFFAWSAAKTRWNLSFSIFQKKIQVIARILLWQTVVELLTTWTWHSSDQQWLSKTVFSLNDLVYHSNALTTLNQIGFVSGFSHGALRWVPYLVKDSLS